MASEKCPKCGEEEATGETRRILNCGYSRLDGWPTYKCGSMFDPSGFCNMRSIQCRDNELSSLQAIIAKLPKYADTGEPFVPGQDYVWLVGKHWLGENPLWVDAPVKAKLVSWWGDHAAVCIKTECGDADIDHWGGPMYSTREAAAAAQAKGAK